MCGHHTKLLARPFKRDTPGCPSWSISMTRSAMAPGITTRLPRRMQPSCILSSSLILQNGRNELSTLDGHPCKTNWRTRDSTGSLPIKLLISLSFTGADRKDSNNNRVSPGRGISSGLTGKGRRLIPSAFPKVDQGR